MWPAPISASLSRILHGSLSHFLPSPKVWGRYLNLLDAWLGPFFTEAVCLISSQCWTGFGCGLCLPLLCPGGGDTETQQLLGLLWEPFVHLSCKDSAHPCSSVLLFGPCTNCLAPWGSSWEEDPVLTCLRHTWLQLRLTVGWEAEPPGCLY